MENIFATARYKPDEGYSPASTNLYVAGVEYRYDNVKAFVSAVRNADQAGRMYGLRAEREPANTYSDHAIRIVGFAVVDTAAGKTEEYSWHIGYVPDDAAKEIVRALGGADARLAAELVGISGGDYPDRYEIEFIVWKSAIRPPRLDITPARGRGQRDFNPAVIVVTLAALGILALMLGKCGSTDRVVKEASVPSVWTPPEGYTLSYTTNSHVPYGFRWLKPKEFDCDLGDACFGAEVVVSEPCPDTFYASISLLDKAGTNIGWTNDTVQSLYPGRKAKLIFSTYEKGVQQAEIAETSCH